MTDYKKPEDLLGARFAALEAGDYHRLYATYHHDAPFLRQFSGEADYLVFARQQLTQIQLRDWQMLAQRSNEEGQQEVILCMEIETAGDSQYFYEMALLISSEQGWRYHSAQKLTAEDYSGAPKKLAFRHFDQVIEKIRI